MDITTVLYIVAVVGYSLYQGYAKRKAKQQGGDKPVQEAENTELPDWMKEIFAEEPKPAPRPRPQAPPPIMEAKTMEPEPMVVKPMKTTPLSKKHQPITSKYETLEDYRPDNRSLETIKSDRIEQGKKDATRAAFMEADSAIYNKAIADMPEEIDFAVDAESLRKGIIYGEILAKRY